MKKVTIVLLMFGAALLAASLSTPSSTSAQDAVQQDVRVRLRMLPATVIDAEGLPVKGLALEDFELLVDGEPRAIRNVDEYDYSVLRQQAAAEELTPEQRRYAADLPSRRFVLVFDVYSSATSGQSGGLASQVGEDYFGNAAQQHLNADQLGDAGTMGKSLDETSSLARARGIQMSKGAARRWLEEELLPTDEVAVISYYFTPELIQPFTKNRKNLLRAIDQVSVPVDLIGPKVNTVDPETGELIAGDLSAKALIAQGSRGYLRFYQSLGKILSSVPGTKQVLLFSEGIAINQSGDSVGTRDYPYNLLPEFQQATSSLASGNTRVTTIGTSGIDQYQLAGPQNEFLAGLAEKTGGRFFRSRARIDGALDEATRNFDHYYELYFSPLEDEGPGLHTVELRVKRAGLQVQAPTVYLGERSYDQMSDTERAARLEQGLWRDLGNELNADLEWHALPVGDGAALHVRAAIPAESLGSGKPEFDALFVMGKDGEMLDRVRWDVTASPGSGGEIQLDFLLPLPEGPASFQFALADRKSGNRAYILSGVDASVEGQKAQVSQLYLCEVTDGADTVQMRERDKPKVLIREIPEAVRQLVTVPRTNGLSAGKPFRVGFIFKGPKFDTAGIQFKQEGNQIIVPGTDLYATDLTNDTRVIIFTTTAPDWPAGEVEMKPLFHTNKWYSLPGRTVELKAREE